MRSARPLQVSRVIVLLDKQKQGSQQGAVERQLAASPAGNVTAARTAAATAACLTACNAASCCMSGTRRQSPAAEQHRCDAP